LAGLIALLFCAAASLEWVLEKRDVERLAATETYAQLGDSRVRYRLTGKDMPGPTVVLLHGMYASAEQWEGFQQQISDKHPVLAYDRGGSGFSDSSAHSGADQARELSQLLDALNIKRPVIVVGYSISSMEARLFAEMFPSKTAGVVLFDPYLPEKDVFLPGSEPGIRRSYARTYISGSLTALFGLRRLKAFREGVHPATPTEERSTVLLWSFHFWWAEAREWWVAEDAQRWLAHSQAPLPPLLYLQNPLAESDPVRPLISRVVARSRHGELRFLPQKVEHSKLLSNPGSRAFLAAAIDELAAGADANEGTQTRHSPQPPGQ
jgi:pimeloyl-ACP methyl ester carboxylesterase